MCNSINKEFICAIQNGELEKVKELWGSGGVDKYFEACNALPQAARYGQTDVINYLISLEFDPLWRESEALRTACTYNQLECVRILLPYSNPKDAQSEALMRAAQNLNDDIVSLLYDTSDPQLALEQMENCPDDREYNKRSIEMLKKLIKSKKEKAKLNQSITPIKEIKQDKEKRKI